MGDEKGICLSNFDDTPLQYLVIISTASAVIRTVEGLLLELFFIFQGCCCTVAASADVVTAAAVVYFLTQLHYLEHCEKIGIAFGRNLHTNIFLSPNSLSNNVKRKKS